MHLFYTPVRLCCNLGLLSVALAAVVAMRLMGGPLAMLIGVLVFAALLKRRRRKPTTHGSAAWAKPIEMLNAGMMEGEGLIIGKAPNASPADLIRMMLSPAISARDACRRVQLRHPYLRLPPSVVHSLVCGPTGCGKTQLLKLLLRYCIDSMIVFDPKGGDLARETAEIRKRMGHRVVILDANNVLRGRADSINFLDRRPEGDELFTEAQALADMIVVSTGRENDPYWKNSARQWLTSLIAMNLTTAKGDKRSLPAVIDVASNPKKLADMMTLMSEMDDPTLRQMGGSFLHSEGKERSSVLATLMEDLRGFMLPGVARTLGSSTYDPQDLVRGRMTVFIVGSPEAKNQKGFLRLLVAGHMRAVMKCGMNHGRKVHVIAEEAAMLGDLKEIEEVLSIGRSFGLRLQLYYQAMGQLKSCWPTDGGQSVLANTGAKIFMGVSDLETARYVSDSLGQESIIVESRNRGSSRSYKSDKVHAEMSDNNGRSWQLQGRGLAMADEVMRRPERSAITLIPGLPPISSFPVRSYEIRRIAPRRRFDRVADWVRLASKGVAGLLLAGCVAFGSAVVIAKKGRDEQAKTAGQQGTGNLERGEGGRAGPGLGKVQGRGRG